MGELYLRKVIIDIIGGGSSRIEDLRCSFSIEKTNEGNPNNGDLSIYNLSDNTRSALEGENVKVKIQIGYEGLQGNGNIEQVAIGDVTKVAHERQVTDIITKVEFADGDNSFRNSRLDKGYPKGTKNKQIFQDLADAINLPIGSKEGIPEFTYANGVSFNGLVKDHLNTMCKKNDLEWSIQDETLQIIPKDQPTPDQVIILSPDTGLVGFPAPTAGGVQFESLLQPQLKVGRQVQLESRITSGTFKLRKITHVGDNMGGDFRSKCEATN